MTQVSMENIYRLWEYTAQMSWDGVRVALQTEDVWEQFGDEEAAELMNVLDEVEQMDFPESAEELYAVLNQYLGE